MSITQRIPHIMKVQKRTSVPSNLMFFDTETRGEKDKTDHSASRQYLWFGKTLAFRLVNGVRTRIKTGTFTKPEQFWTLVEQRLTPGQPLYVFAHNLVFDLTITDFWRLSEKLGYDIEFAILEDPPTVISCIYKGYKVVFVDTVNYWRLPLKVMGEALDLPKLEMP